MKDAFYPPLAVLQGLPISSGSPMECTNIAVSGTQVLGGRSTSQTQYTCGASGSPACNTCGAYEEGNCINGQSVCYVSRYCSPGLCCLALP